MSAKHIIKSSDDISLVLKKGKKFHNPLFTLFVLKTPEHRDPCGRVAFIAAKRLGNAVWRNRSKRVMRAAFRDANVLTPGYDIVIMAKRSTEQAGSVAVSEEIVRTLTKCSTK